MQVLSMQLNQICALSKLRQKMTGSCLVGLVGGINAGKTSLSRALRGLPFEKKAHKSANATRRVTAVPMPVYSSEGLKATSASPLLLDTPGLFDADSALADCATRHFGEPFSEQAQC